MHFEALFGPRGVVWRGEGLTVVGVDSTEPDLDHGHIGRARYPWLEAQFAHPADFRIFMLHHHLLPVPGTGRERNVVYDAGDVLEVLQRCRVDLVLSGHKHVPYAWRLEDIFVVNTGTACSLRLRGNTKPCYTIIVLDEDEVRVETQVPVPRHQADPPLLAQHAAVHEDRERPVRRRPGRTAGRGRPLRRQRSGGRR